MARYERELFQIFENLRRQMNTRPLNLGGIAGNLGGQGGPPGGFTGQLPQNRAAFDTAELAVLEIPATGVALPSGRSLVTNLNRIRYRLTQLEEGGGGGSGISSIEIQHDDVSIGNATVLNFEGGVEVTDEGSGKVTVTVVGSGGGGGITGIDIYDSGGLFKENVTILNFSGKAVAGNFGASGVDIEVSALDAITAYQDNKTPTDLITETASSIIFHQPLYGIESGFGNNLEILTSGIMVQENDVDVIRTNTINFEGGATVTEDSGVVTVTISGNGAEEHNHIYNEDMSDQFGTQTFGTNYVYESGTLRLYYNGLRQTPVTYSTDRLNRQFTVAFVPSGVDTLYVDYNYLESEQAIGWGVIPWGTGDWGG